MTALATDAASGSVAEVRPQVAHLPANVASEQPSETTSKAGAAARESLVLVEARERLEAAKLKTALWDHYVGFATFKASGFATLGVAALELLNPALIPLAIDPLTSAAAGFALLTGKTVVGLINRLSPDEPKKP